jgi:hypothetical protein
VPFSRFSSQLQPSAEEMKGTAQKVKKLDNGLARFGSEAESPI